MKRREQQIGTRFSTALLLIGMLCGCADDKANDGDDDKADSGVVDVEFDPKNCLHQGNVQINSDADQGLAAYCEIQGNVEVGATVTDAGLEQLRHVHTIQGVLYIVGTSLESLDGLRSLKMIASDLLVHDNKELSSFYGLEQLEHVGGALSIVSNPLLGHLDALAKLSSVGKGIQLDDNVALQQFDALVKIDKVSDRVSITRNGKIRNLKGLGGLANAGSQGLFIEENALLRTDEGLNRLVAAGKQLVFRKNSQLKHIKNLQLLQHVKEIRIVDNLELEEIDGFPMLLILDRLYLRYNKTLLKLAGFPKITLIDAIEVKGNKNMQTLNGFPFLKVATSLHLEENQTLSEVRFKKLDTVNTFHIIESMAFTSFKGFLPLKNIKELKICNTGLSQLAVEDFVKSRHDPKPTLKFCD